MNSFNIYQQFSHYSITLSLRKNHRQEQNNERKVEKYTMDIWENFVLSLEALSKLTKSQSYLMNWVHKLRIPNNFWQWGTKSLNLNIKESFKKTLNLVPNKLFPKRRQVKHIKKILNFKKAEFLEEPQFSFTEALLPPSVQRTNCLWLFQQAELPAPGRYANLMVRSQEPESRALRNYSSNHKLFYIFYSEFKMFLK